jgi:peroxiredoxin
LFNPLNGRSQASEGEMEVVQRNELKTGNLIPLFSLPAVNGAGNISPWDYKQHKNLVLIFFRDPECNACLGLLRELASRYEEYRELNAEILAIVNIDLKHLGRLQRELKLPFPLLSDRDAKVFDSYADGSGVAQPIFGVFIADRWGALFSKTLSSEIGELPRNAEIRGWLSFIEIQCPECFPPEPWPGD